VQNKHRGRNGNNAAAEGLFCSLPSVGRENQKSEFTAATASACESAAGWLVCVMRAGIWFHFCAAPHNRPQQHAADYWKFGERARKSACLPSAHSVPSALNFRRAHARASLSRNSTPSCPTVHQVIRQAGAGRQPAAHASSGAAAAAAILRLRRIHPPAHHQHTPPFAVRWQRHGRRARAAPRSCLM
jgi:hypothetical protein